ncbi:MAG: PAS domain S-box protein [Chitinophagaceae bacterium]|nr:PAS domain S-box protein [Chitinophagaceae bacterium]
MRKNVSVKWNNDKSEIAVKAPQDKPLTAIRNNKVAAEMPLTEGHSEKDFTAMPQLQRIAENMPGIMLEYESTPDGTHGYTYISPAFERIFGVRTNHIFKITQFLHPDDLGEMNKALKKAADTLAPFYIESRMILPGRGIVWRSMNCSFSHFTNAGAKVFMGLMLDISERKKADEKLNESENRLVSLITNLQNGILVEDENRKVVLTNEMYCDMFGINASPENLKGEDCTDFVDRTRDLFKDSDFFEEKILSLLDFQKPELDEILEMKDGRILKRDYIPICNNKIYKGHLWKYTDVTAEKYAEQTLMIREEKYRSIIDNMNLGLLEVDTEENIIFANQCFCDMCGYEMDELIGKRAAQIFAKGENIELMDQKNEERKRGTTDAYEIVVKDKRGQVRWWLISGAPRYNDKGELVGSIGIHLDITDQKQLEIELTVAREQAEQSTRSKEVFLANMSHEIRTPMNAILGMSNQLAKSPLTKKQLFYLDAINAASENLLVIINDILDLSKIEAGKLSLEKIAFEPRAVIKRAMQALIHKAQEKGLALTNSILDERISEVMIGDPYRLNQILLNIISNAVKFTEKGGVDVKLEVINDAKHSQTVQLTVKDTGIGMDEKFRKSLFEKFSQEDASVTRQYGGTGLGMSICRQLIELMDGEIFVDSEKGTGTTMSFVITLSKGSIQDLPSKEIFVADEKMLVGKKILVVDDNDMNRLLATTILGNYGAETFEAENGQESVDYLAGNTVDLVLMDIQMPVMNGFDAAKYIRENISATLPMIALTANAIKGDNEKCIEAGLNTYLAKPFKEEDLMKMIAGMLNTNPSLNMQKKVAVIDTEEPEPVYYDISEIRTISRGNEGFINKMLKMFVEQIPVHLSEMKEKCREQQYITVGEIAHRIKPTIDNMGIISSKTLIRELEKMGKANEDNGTMAALIKKVGEDVDKAVEAIKKDFQL